MYDSDTIKDAIQQLQAGSTLAPVELTRIALAPACTLEQCHQITSAMYAVLDHSHLQMSKADESRFPVQQVLCLSGLAPIISRHRRVSSDDHSIIETLRRHWPPLQLWIVYLIAHFVDKENVDFSFRLLAKKSIADFLGICDDTTLRYAFDYIVGSQGIIAALFDLWRLETQDPRFSLSDDPSSWPIFHTQATLDSWMCTFSERETWSWREILSPFCNDAGALATTALDHLRRDIARTPINHDLILWDLHLLTTLSVNDAIRISLLDQNSMTLVASVVSSFASRHVTTEPRAIVAKCLSYGYWYIRAYVESTEGIPWVTQIVEAGLLPAILSMEPWFEHLEDQHSEDWESVFLLLKNIIPQYSLYVPVLDHLIKQLTMIDMGDLPDKLKKCDLLFQSWTIFESVVRRRAALYYMPASNETHITSCQNVECNMSGPPGSFGCCEGCLHVYYCSKECQANDWTNGNHQHYCRDIQARRTAGLVSNLSTRDVHFINRVITQDLSLFRSGIGDAGIRLNVNPVVVELDYTELPAEAEIGSIHTVPIDACECDVAMTQKWTHMVELAQSSPSKKVLVRAFLPRGTSEKVKFLCLPLKWALGDHTRGAEEEAVFDETFDMLYSRAGQSFGVVDATFPNEAMRAWMEKAN